MPAQAPVKRQPLNPAVPVADVIVLLHHDR
jgi:hypothetical protein